MDLFIRHPHAKRLKLGELAPDVAVLDAAGQPYQLSAGWRGGPVLLTFLRHFG
jgi:hypothetical protein